MKRMVKLAVALLLCSSAFTQAAITINCGAISGELATPLITGTFERDNLGLDGPQAEQTATASCSFPEMNGQVNSRIALSFNRGGNLNLVVQDGRTYADIGNGLLISIYGAYNGTGATNKVFDLLKDGGWVWIFDNTWLFGSSSRTAGINLTVRVRSSGRGTSEAVPPQINYGTILLFHSRISGLNEIETRYRGDLRGNITQNYAKAKTCRLEQQNYSTQLSVITKGELERQNEIEAESLNVYGLNCQSGIRVKAVLTDMTDPFTQKSWLNATLDANEQQDSGVAFVFKDAAGGVYQFGPAGHGVLPGYQFAFADHVTQNNEVLNKTFRVFYKRKTPNASIQPGRLTGKAKITFSYQ